MVASRQRVNGGDSPQILFVSHWQVYPVSSVYIWAVMEYGVFTPTVRTSSLHSLIYYTLVLHPLMNKTTNQGWSKSK